MEMTPNHHKNSCKLAVFIIFCICYSRNMTDLLLNAQKICSENMYFLNVCVFRGLLISCTLKNNKIDQIVYFII